MKHVNNIRDRLDNKPEYVGLGARRATGEKTNMPRSEQKNDRIAVRSGEEHAGLGAERTEGVAGPIPQSVRSMDEMIIRKDVDEAAVKRSEAEEQKSWIKGSYESKRMTSHSNVKSKL